MAGSGAGSAGGTMEMLKSMSMKAGKAMSDATQKTVDAVSEGTRNFQQSKAGAQTSAAMTNIGTRAAEGGSWIYNSTRSTTQGLMDRFVGGSVGALSAREAKDAPCPRMVLVCCNAICAGGLASESLFQGPTDDEDVAQLLTLLTSSDCTTLLPPSATPQLISNALKRWLQELRPEPLLTYKLVPALTSASTPNASLGAVLDELPLANRRAVMLILETAHRIASNAAINETDAGTMAAALSPVLLWREGPVPDKTALPPDAPAEARKPPPEALPVEEEAVFVKLLTFMIQHYRTFA